MPAKGCPFPGSKELFELCRWVADRSRGRERSSDVELGRLVGFENARTSRWKHGRIEVSDAAKLVALSKALEVDLVLLAQVAAGRLRAPEALRVLEDTSQHLKFVADNLVPAAEGHTLRLTDATGQGYLIERLGPRKLERREVSGLTPGAGGPAVPRRRVALLADDDPEVGQLFLNAAREQPSVDPLLATSIPQALVMAGRCRPDLVLLDLFLPGSDGFAALRSLRADPSTSAAHLVATSLHLSPEVAERAKACGAAELVARPLKVRYLTQTLRGLL